MLDPALVAATAASVRSAATSSAARGRDTSRARIADSSETFIPAIMHTRLHVAPCFYSVLTYSVLTYSVRVLPARFPCPGRGPVVCPQDG